MMVFFQSCRHFFQGSQGTVAEAAPAVVGRAELGVSECLSCFSGP